MSGKKIPGLDLERYEQLLVHFRPRPIHNSKDLAAAESVVDELLAREALNPEEDAILDLITTLVEEWEREHVSVPAAEPREVIRFLLESGAHRQKDLVSIFGSESIVSEVLSGRRDLQRKHIVGMARFFHVSPAVFFGDIHDGIDAPPLAANA